MKVSVETWSGARVMPLVAALTPESSYEGGTAERAHDDAKTALDVLGRLLTALVEKRTLTIDEAAEIAGQHGAITEVKG